MLIDYPLHKKCRYIIPKLLKRLKSEKIKENNYKRKFNLYDKIEIEDL
ncbi:hypothetical protein HMPREF9089_00965 [Eubacterium brachy ATCC 33089]|nr:hypothetical protein HMPREF9089_00965 [Eubacterium brachy ATCC 33089]